MVIEKQSLLLAILLILPQPLFSIKGPHISDVNILLPPMMTNPVEYRLQGSDGCFHWSWDHHDVLFLLPEYNFTTHCSTSARLRSITHFVGRVETAIYATDKHTGLVLRCRVFIDNIHRIQVFHSSINLDLDDLATLSIRAFDREDNVFTSLVGLQFIWQLKGSPHALVHVPLEDSPLSDCDGLCGDLGVQKRLEGSGVFSDLFVVKGIGVGSEIVSVHVLEPGLEHIKDEIVLRVVEVISIEPQSPVFVLIGAFVRYKIKVTHGSDHQVLAFPYTNYIWSISNSTVAELENMRGFVHALNLGEAIVTVEDTRVSGHMQICSIHVVVPDSLDLYILSLPLTGYVDDEGVNPVPSGSVWYISSHHPYVVYVKAFTEKYGWQEISITPNDVINLQCFQISSVQENLEEDHGWQKSWVLTTNSTGLGKLEASLSYFTGNAEDKEVLKVVQEVMVCEPVNLGKEFPSSVLLPWAPGVYQVVELKATGGCAEVASDYKWFSSDESIVSVSDDGVLQAKGLGNATLRVGSVFDPFNYHEVPIEVCSPSIVLVQNLPAEIVLGSYIVVLVTMKSPNDAYFFKCDAFDSLIKWRVERGVFRIINKAEPLCYETYKTIELRKSVFYPCGWTCLLASEPGRTLLHATLPMEDQQYGFPLPEASSEITAFTPLQVCQAGDGNSFGGYWVDLGQSRPCKNLVHFYLVPGSQMDISLVGGPERRDSNYLESLDVLNGHGSSLRDDAVIARTGNGGMYRVFCEASGTFDLVFKRGNLPNHVQPFHSVDERHVLLFCSFPLMVVMIIDEPVNTPEVIQSAIEANHGLDTRAISIMVEDGRSIRVAAVGLTRFPNIFANSSSLCMTWELINCEGLAYWEPNYVKLKCTWERFLKLQNRTGQCILHANVTSLRHASRNHPDTLLIKGDLSYTVHLQFVSMPKLQPHYILLFFSSHAKANLTLCGGSRFFDVAVNDSRVIEVVKPSSTLECFQLILLPKESGTALITVNDFGLTTSFAASSVVCVTDIDWIKIISPRMITLMEGSIHFIKLMAGVKDGRIFDSSQFTYMNVFVHIEDHIVELLDTDHGSTVTGGYINGPEFVILAKHVGSTNISVSARQHLGRQIFSEALMIEVCEPPNLHPSSLFLAPGASYMITLKGGPKTVSHIEFASTNERVAAIDKSCGHISASSSGNTTIIATILGPNGSILSQVHSEVNVGIPSYVKLTTPSTRLAIHREMLIYPSFDVGNLFSFHQICNNHIWTIQDREIMSFQKVVNSSDYPDQDLSANHLGFIRVLYGRSSGYTSVGLSFSCDFGSQLKSYSAAISLRVVPDVPIEILKETWILPPHYTSSSILPTSKDKSYSLIRDCDRDMNGLTIMGDRIKTGDPDKVECVVTKYIESSQLEIVTCIRVSEVAQIRVMGMVVSESTPISLDMGVELELPIGYFDSLGNPFHETYNAVCIIAETNFPDILFIKSSHCSFGGVHIKGMRPGEALLRVYDQSNPLMSDYVMVNVIDAQCSYKDSAVSLPEEGDVGAWYSDLNNATLIGAICSLLTVFAFFIMLDRRSEGLATLATSDGGVSDDSTQQSPRTPPVFVEYVRRTIDETPYRREGRPRFNT